MSDFARKILTALIAVARADGKFDPAERAMLRAVQKYLDVTDTQLRELISEVKPGSVVGDDSSQTQQNIYADHQALACAFYLSFRLAIADGHLSGAEAELLIRIADGLNLSHDDLRLLIENTLAAPHKAAVALIDDFFNEHLPQQAPEARRMAASADNSNLADKSEQIIHNVLVMAMADGKICDVEKGYLATLVKSLGMTPQRFRQISAKVKKSRRKIILRGSVISQIQSARLLVESALADGRLDSAELGLLKNILSKLGASDSDLYTLTEILCDEADTAKIDQWFEQLSARQARIEGLALSDKELPDDRDAKESEKTEPNWTLRLVTAAMLAVGVAIGIIGYSLSSLSGQLDIETFDKACAQMAEADSEFSAGEIHSSISSYRQALALVENRKCDYQPWCDTIDILRSRLGEAEAAWDKSGYKKVELLYIDLVSADFEAGSGWVSNKHAELLAAIERIIGSGTEIKDSYMRELMASVRSDSFLADIKGKLRSQYKAHRAEQLRPSLELKVLFLLLGIFGSGVLIMVSMYQDSQVKLLTFAGILLAATLGGFGWWAYYRYTLGEDALKIWAKSNIWTMVILGWFVFRFFYILSSRCPCCGTYLVRQKLSTEVEDHGWFNRRRDYIYHWICCRCEYEWTTMSTSYRKRSLAGDVFRILSRM